VRSGLAIVVTVLVAVLVATIVAACGAMEASYFPTEGQTTVGIPRTEIVPAYFGIALLEAAQGDRVRLEGIEPLGVRGEPTIEGIAAVLGDERTWIGASVEHDFPAEIDLSTYRPLEGMEFDDGDGPVAFAVRVSGSAPLLGFDAIRLRFRVNGGPAQVQTVQLRGLVCTETSLVEAGNRCRAELEVDGGPTGRSDPGARHNGARRATA
jgi:hypothetical protein